MDMFLKGICVILLFLFLGRVHTEDSGIQNDENKNAQGNTTKSVEAELRTSPPSGNTTNYVEEKPKPSPPPGLIEGVEATPIPEDESNVVTPIGNGYGGECSNNDQCIEGLICNYKCLCKEPLKSHWNGSSCVQRKQYGAGCSRKDQCIEDLICKENCSCSDISFWDGSSCASRNGYDGECRNDDQCIEGLICNHKCSCKEPLKSYWNGSSCVQRKQYGGECSRNDHCIQDLICNGNCSCRDIYFWDGSSCVTRNGYGGECSNGDQCIEGLICNHTCLCKEPLTSYWNGNSCVQKPVIMDCGNLKVANASSDSIYLNTTSLQVSYASCICVSSLNTSFGNQQCFETWSAVVVLKKLTSATEYHLKINAVINSNDTSVSSLKTCHIVAATYPVLNCSSMSINDEGERYAFNFNSSNQRNLKNITVFVTSTKENETLPFPIGRDKLDFTLEPGTLYHFVVMAKGPGNLWTMQPCILTQDTDIKTPECGNVLKSISNTEIHLDLTMCHSPGINKFQVRVKSFQRIYDRYETDIPIRKLAPGTQYSLEISSVVFDQSNVQISPQTWTKVFSTKPDNPNCTQLLVLKTSNTVTINTSTLITAGAVFHEFLFNNKTKRVFLNETTKSFYNLTSSHLYDLEVYSFGDTSTGNQKSDRSCKMNIVTRPKDPVCNRSFIKDIGLTNLTLDLSGINTGDVKYISVSYINNYRVNTINITNEASFKYLVTNLTQGSLYFFDIATVGLQNVRSLNFCSVSNYTVPAQPGNVNMIERNNTHLSFEWKHSAGLVESYEVSARCNCTQKCPCKSYTLVHTKGNSSTASIGKLLAGAQCHVAVTAVSGKFKSTPRKFILSTNESVPSNVTEFNVTNVTSNSVSISWTTPTCPNGKVISYETGIHDLSDSSSSTANLFSTIGNLTAGTCYVLFVAANNKAGQGQSSELTIYTLETEPDVVQTLSARNTSSTSVSVYWNKPVNTNGVIIKYNLIIKQDGRCIRRISLNCDDCTSPCPEVTLKQGGRQGRFKSEKAPEEDECPSLSETINNTTHLEYNVKDLAISTSYEFEVLAFTAKGQSSPKTIQMRTSDDFPSAPQNLRTSDVSKSNIVLRFDKPEFENGNLTHFQIEYKYKYHKNCDFDKNKASQVIKYKNETLTENRDQYSTSIEGLNYFWSYTIRVRMATYVGYGNYSEPIEVQTKPWVPDPVLSMSFGPPTSRSVNVSWNPPCHPNGLVKSYRITIKNNNISEESMLDTNQSIPFHCVKNLLPYVDYSFSVSTEVFNVNDLGAPYSSPDVIRTSSEAPYMVRNLMAYKITSSSISVNWELPELKTGPTQYNVSVTDKATRKIVSFCIKEGFNNTNCTVSNLDSYWNYSLKISVITMHKENSTFLDNQRTAESAPGPLTHVAVNQENNVTAPRKVFFNWRSPTDRDLNGIIRGYFIRYLDSMGVVKEFNYSSTMRSAAIPVIAERNYTFQMFAMTVAKASEKDFYNVTKSIKAGAPIPISLPPGAKRISKGPSSQVQNDEKQLHVFFNKRSLCDNENGNPVKWYIIVAKNYQGTSVPFQGKKEEYEDMIKKKKKYMTWNDVYDNDNNKLYVASDSYSPHCSSGARERRDAEQTVSFIVGRDGECGSSYCNGYLEPNTNYRIRFTVCTNGGCSESEFSDPITTEPNFVPVIAGSVSGVVAAIIFIFVLIVYMRRKKMGPFKKKETANGECNEGFSSPMELGDVSKPRAVKIADFAGHVQKMHADSNLGFSREYKFIKDNCATHTTKAAEIQVNRIKNRYTNILAYDHSRVKLLPTEDDEGSDYINANYIPGFSSPREYIATQGALPFTRDEFWRMIWEQNVSIIVMLTQLIERGRRKCDIYWPETTREPVYYGDLVVEIESESTLPDYVLRVMSVKLGDTRKTVKHFAYLAWPDMGIPETSEAMLKFAKEVRSHQAPPTTNRGPFVVHCSAGVGRTGTFIAVDYLMQYVRTSDVIDIYSLVMKMRNNRPNMVQTEDQYIFIHDCINDFVNKGDDDSDDEECERNEQAIYENV